MKTHRIVIIGAGNVGTATAYTLCRDAAADEIVLIDKAEEKALGEALDMLHASAFMADDVLVRTGDYSDCRDADIIILTASAPMDKNAKSRLEMLAPTKRVMKSIMTRIRESGFEGILIVVSNPLDVMTYYAYRLSGLPSGHVIGSGTNLDTGRLRLEIARYCHVPTKDVNLFVLGEHGASETVVFSKATVSQRLLLDLMKADPQKFGNKTPEDLRQDNIKSGFEIFYRKGNTCYGIAASVAQIVHAIVNDTNELLPVSVLSQGQYGIRDVYLSLPSRLGKHGAVATSELVLTAEETAQLQASARSIESFYDALKD